MLDLAIHHGEGPITLADIAQRQGISLSYLEQLFSRLRKQNLVSSVRGPGGGYSLGREAGGIFVAQVISAVDENVDTTRCGGAHNCQDNQQCLTHDLWQDLMNRRGVQEVVERQAAAADIDVPLRQLKAETVGA
jgi:Rrf2 family iron-sulfur cluster assembly transcriptional regulator